MKIKVRIILLLLGFSMHSFCQNTNYIEIKHTGYSDKPIWTILISTQNIKFQDDAVLRTTIVENSSFSQVKRFILAYDYSKNEKLLDPDSYGTFTINIGNTNKKPELFNTYQLVTIEKSRDFFKKLINYCKVHKFNTDLINQLLTTESRIRIY